MKPALIALFFTLSAAFCFAQIWPVSLAGRWTFDDPSNPLQASVGSNLVLTGSHIPLAGPAPGDSAVAIGVGSYYTCTHGIPANGGGSYVNEYSLLFDIMIDNPNVYHSLFQTKQNNSNDGDAFINTNSQLGISATGYSAFSIKNRTWYRVLITVDNGSSFRYYVNGHLVREGIPQAVDLTYGVESTLLFFADDNSEDNLIYCAQLAIFSSCLTAAEVKGLGGFRASDIMPYLQTPATDGMTISWHSQNTASSIIQYGTTTVLGQSATGSSEAVSSDRWHTVVLSGLTSDTRYYYRCISGDDTSAMYHFRTLPQGLSQAKYLRILKVGDSQANAGDVSRLIADTIVYKMRELYGNDWMDSVHLVIHSGDLVQNGTEIGRYGNEFFNPYSAISAYVPIMVSIGNHESESPYYYQYVKYESLTGNNEKYYTFNIGPCQFISLNTNGLYNNSTQTSWLQTQMNTSAVNPDIQIVFVFNHQPAHSEMWPDGNTSYVENSVLPVLVNYPKMAMITWGHAHNYERGTILADHPGDWDFRAVLCGGAGGALDRWGMYSNQTNYPEIQKSADHYSFMLLEVDMSSHEVDATSYSLGHSNKPLNLTVIDRWHRYFNRPAPLKPDALIPFATATAEPVLTASPFSGADTLMSSRFQLALISGSFNAPLLDVIRDVDDWYGDSGAPLFMPVNLNNGIDLSTYQVPAGLLQTGETYMWRMRYRDQNLRWSEWSDTLQFTVTATGLPENPVAARTQVFPNPSSKGFTISTQMETVFVFRVLDMSGRELLAKSMNPAGASSYVFGWDARDAFGKRLEAGCYTLIIESTDERAVMKVLITSD
jgi:hypothetical protein